MTRRPVRLLALALSLAAALPAAPALAGWRDVPFYGEEGWGGEFEPPMRAYRPAPFYGDDEPGYEGRSFYPRRWMREPLYGLDAEEPYDVPHRRRGPAMRPRMIVRVPEGPPRTAPPKARSAASSAPKPAAAPKPESVQEARALPVPRPNLESMDFETAK